MIKNTCTYCLNPRKKAEITRLSCSHSLCQFCLSSPILKSLQKCPFCQNSFQPSELHPNSNSFSPSIILPINETFQKNPNLDSFLSSLLSQKEIQQETLSSLKSLKNLHENLKLSEKLKNHLKDSLPELLNKIKKFEIFSFLKQKIYFGLNYNDFISRKIFALSTIALNREKKIVGKPGKLAWLGNKIRFHNNSAMLLNDIITITSEFPILIKTVGVGLSPCSKSKIRYLELSVYDSQKNFVGNYNLRENRCEKGRLTCPYRLETDMLLESGVEYNFTYKVERFCVYIILNDQPVSHRKYLISTGGASMTFYLEFNEF